MRKALEKKAGMKFTPGGASLRVSSLGSRSRFPGIRSLARIKNKYRVLLTRARLATVIWVPQGDVDDATRATHDLNAIAEFLEAAGARPL
jgi:hypothetical protein